MANKDGKYGSKSDKGKRLSKNKKRNLIDVLRGLKEFDLIESYNIQNN